MVRPTRWRRIRGYHGYGDGALLSLRGCLGVVPSLQG